ncbi:MAG: septum formation protein Maf [Myxococcales bacterium]|nr:septum formation protein Maf [Myxococcales bacterium]
MPPLVLASTSPYRRALLARLRVPFEAIAPRCDEAAVARLGLPADALTTTLARMKAQSVHARRPEALVLGSDQVVELDGDILGKPGDAAGARAQLARLAARTHRLVTAVTLLGPGGFEASRLVVHSMQMRALSPEAIARYVDAEQPIDCAGSYKIEGLGVALFERMQGDDCTAIEGLPLVQVVALLGEAGVAVP